MKEREFAQLAVSSAFKGLCTDGDEFVDWNRLEAEGYLPKDFHETKVGYCTCDHCGGKILAVTDRHATNGWTYQGVHASGRKSYRYSPVVRSLQDADGNGLAGKDGQVYHVYDLANSHMRAHAKPSSWNKPINWCKMLCNRCFAQTYHRQLVLGKDGVTYAVSVVQEWGETLQSVLQELGLEVEAELGKGSVREY